MVTSEGGWSLGRGGGGEDVVAGGTLRTTERVDSPLGGGAGVRGEGGREGGREKKGRGRGRERER